jgi:hypothetical protein
MLSQTVRNSAFAWCCRLLCIQPELACAGPVQAHGSNGCASCACKSRCSPGEPLKCGHRAQTDARTSLSTICKGKSSCSTQLTLQKLRLS